MPRTPVVTLVTDFGQDDPYVGAMKGVIASICHNVTLLDLSNGVTPHSVLEGALALEMAYRYCPEDCIHLVVVDPGVGTERRCIAARAGKWLFVAPDNGVLTFAIENEPRLRAVSIEQPAYRLSSAGETFAGRDIMAPAAGYLAEGLPLERLGPPIDDPVRLELPKAKVETSGIEAHIIYIDRFGNCITDLKEEEFETWKKSKSGNAMRVKAGDTQIEGISRYYAQKGEEEPLALFSSSSRLEIAVNRGDAARLLGLATGDVVTVTGA